MNSFKSFLKIFFTFSPLLLNGCAALLIGGAAGAGTIAYIRGELKSTEQMTMDQAWATSEHAVRELGFVVTYREKDEVNAKLVSRDSKDTRIEISMHRVTEQTTDIRIRVGVFGNENMSRTILDKIHSLANV